MKRLALIVLLLLVLVPAATVAYFVYIFDWNRARGWLGETSSETAGRKIAITGDLTVDWGWPVTHITAGGIEVDNMKGGSDPLMLSLKKLEIAFDIPSILRGNLALPELTLSEPDLLLEKNRAGEANWRFGDNPAGAMTTALAPEERGEFPIIERLIIEEGEVSYRDLKAKTNLSLTAATAAGKAGSDERRIRFKGKGIYEGQPLNVDFTGASVLTLRESEHPYPVSLSLDAGDTAAKVEGTMLDPIRLRGMNVQMQLSGNNAADLFPLTGIALPPTPPYAVEGRLEYGKDLWRFTDFKGRMGDSDLGGDVTWDVRKKRPKFTGNFASRILDFDDLGGFIGATPGTGPGETASPEQKQQSAQEEADTRALPDAPLDISRVAAMDAMVVFSGKRVISGKLPLDDFAMKVDLENRLLKLTPVRFGTADGDIEARITINARAEPVRIDGDFRFRRLALARLLAPAAKAVEQPNVASGYIGGTASLAGKGKSLREYLASSDGNVGLGMEGGQLSNLIVELIGLDIAESLGFLVKGDEPVAVRCVVGDFKVDDGLARTRAFVIDTADTLVVGEGSLDLNDESIDFTLKPHPKDPSPLTLRSPLEVKGTLKDPEVGVNKERLIARGAIAAILGALFPPAAIVAFIEPGLGEDSDCESMLTEMSVHTGTPATERLVPENPSPPHP